MKNCEHILLAPSAHSIHREEWKWPLFGVHSTMVEKSSQPGKGGGARPSHFTTSSITYKVVAYAPAERADTLPLLLLYPNMYSVDPPTLI